MACSQPLTACYFEQPAPGTEFCTAILDDGQVKSLLSLDPGASANLGSTVDQLLTRFPLTGWEGLEASAARDYGGAAHYVLKCAALLLPTLILDDYMVQSTLWPTDATVANGERM